MVARSLLPLCTVLLWVATVLQLEVSAAAVADCSSATNESECFAAFVTDTKNQCGWNGGSNRCVDCASLVTQHSCEVTNEGACVMNTANGTCSSNGFAPSLFLTEDECNSTRGSYRLQRLVWNESLHTCSACASFDPSVCPSSFCIRFSSGNYTRCIAPQSWCPNISSTSYCQTWSFGSCFWKGDRASGSCVSCAALQDAATCSAAPYSGCLWNPTQALCEGNPSYVTVPPASCAEAHSQSECYSVHMTMDALQCGWDSGSSSCVNCSAFDESACRAFPLTGPCGFNEAVGSCASSGFPFYMYASAAECNSAKALDDKFRRLVWDTSSSPPACRQCENLDASSNVTCPRPKCGRTESPNACFSFGESCATYPSVDSCASVSGNGCFWLSDAGLCRWCGSISSESSCAPLSSSTCAWDALNLICTAPVGAAPVPSTPAPPGNASDMIAHQLSSGAAAGIAIGGSLGLAALVAVVVLVVVPFIRSGRNAVHVFPEGDGEVVKELKSFPSASENSVTPATSSAMKPDKGRVTNPPVSAVVVVNEKQEPSPSSSHSPAATAANVTLASLSVAETPRTGAAEFSLPTSEARATQSFASTGSAATRGSGDRETSESRRSSSSNVVQLQQEGAVQRVKLIGRGSFGNVYSCLLPDGSLVAMKEVVVPGADSLDAASSAAGTTALISEVNIVSSLVHPNIVRFYGAVTEPQSGNVLIFMELVNGGSLGGMVRGMSSPLQEAAAKVFARQIVGALAFIHRNRIVHRDLKCDNILVATDGTLKLSDFGASKVVAAVTSLGGTLPSTHGGALMASRGAATMVGTPSFIAPEVLLSGTEDEDQERGGDGDTSSEGDRSRGELRGDGGYGRRADVWSLGILLCEMMDCGRIPWPSFPNVAVALMHIASPKSLPILPSHLSTEARAFIMACCQRDPTKRPTSESLLSHPWLAL